MSTKIDPECITAVPLTALLHPRDGEVLTDRWWVVRDGGLLGEALFYRGRGSRGFSPQCNHDKRVSEGIRAKLYPDADLRFIETAYLGQWNEEWGYTLPWLKAWTDG